MAKIKISTSLGDIVVRLYDETPLHRDNMIKLVKEGRYDGTLFHRVIKEFMVQGGDPESKGAPKGRQLGSGDVGYTIPAEFNPALFHKRGALAAARQGDQVNPERRSSGCQFYIVWGKKYNESQLAQLSKQMRMQEEQNVFNRLASQHRDEIMDMRRKRDQAGLMALQDQLLAETSAIMAENKAIGLSAGQKAAYSTIGGTPFLDGQYTVFGEVESGLEVVGAIEQVSTDGNDRPVKDIAMNLTVVEE